MIPIFPEFKKIELSDKENVELLTKNYPPYSDFNFISMWSWDINEDMRISQLNGNLVVRFSDYITGELFFSFLGTKDVNETAQTLFDLARTENIQFTLKLIPEETANSLDKKIFNIIEDIDHFDYLLSVSNLLPHNGEKRKLSSRRKIIQKLKQLSHFSVKTLDLHNPETASEIQNVSVLWEEQKGVSEEEALHLSLALKRILEIKDCKDILALGVYVYDELIGYTINEVLGTGYAIGNFQQADTRSSLGAYALLMQETAVYLNELGCKTINLEQDLGIAGLRKWKMSYNPVAFLKKYQVTLINES